MVYSFWIDSLPRLINHTAEVDPIPLKLLLTGGSHILVPLTDLQDGLHLQASQTSLGIARMCILCASITMRPCLRCCLQSTAIQSVLVTLGAAVGDRLLLELQEEQCSSCELVARVRIIKA